MQATLARHRNRPGTHLLRELATRYADIPYARTWPERRLIVEIDGPQYHQFAEEDARKQRVWEAAGYTVRRIRSDVVDLSMLH